MQDLEERPTGPTSPNRVVILTSSPERASSNPKRATIQGQEEEFSQEELGRVIAKRQEELRQLMEGEASGRAPEGKSKFY